MAQTVTLLLLIAVSGNRFLKAVAQQHFSAGSPLEPMPRSCAHAHHGSGSPVQLLDAAAICVVPVSSVLLARSVFTSGTSLHIANEGLLAVAIALFVALFAQQVLPHLRQLAVPAAQPTKGACFADLSPNKGLATAIACGPRIVLTRLRQFGRRCVQRRRLYVHRAFERLERFLPSLCGKPSPLAALLRRPSAARSHGLHDWHEAMPAGFLMPVEVAACRFSPDVSSSLQRLLADRWWALEVEQHDLAPVPEDECLVSDE